jgi:hypothetical protein
MGLRGKEIIVEKRFDFDALARMMASGLPRREALRRLGGGLAGALLASLGLGKASGAPTTNSECQEFCQNNCGISPSDGNAFRNCVQSCKKCLNTDRELSACPPSAGADVVCTACRSDEFHCFDGSCCKQPCCGSVCCKEHEQCDSESSICF